MFKGVGVQCLGPRPLKGLMHRVPEKVSHHYMGEHEEPFVEALFVDPLECFCLPAEGFYKAS